jgi:RNA polymerase sigma-70 factor (sigma-E family)
MDHDDYVAFVTARWPGLVRAAMLLGASRPEAEDVVQTALEGCLRSWRRVSAADDLDAYVYRSVVNAFTRSRRRRWWAERPTERLPERAVDSADLDRAAIAPTVLSALGRLSPDHREVLVLRFYADLSERQAAEVLGVPPGTVKSRTSRALDRIAADPTLAALFNHEET